MSSYRDTYDDRAFYEIRGTKESNMSVLSICENCLRELTVSILPIAYPEIATVVETVLQFPDTVRGEVIEELEQIVNNVDY